MLQNSNWSRKRPSLLTLKIRNRKQKLIRFLLVIFSQNRVLLLGVLRSVSSPRCRLHAGVPSNPWSTYPQMATSWIYHRHKPRWDKHSLFNHLVSALSRQYDNLFCLTLTLDLSIIFLSTGLGFRPLPPEDNVESTLIWYRGTNRENFEVWTNALDEFLSRKFRSAWRFFIVLDYMILKLNSNPHDAKKMNYLISFHRLFPAFKVQSIIWSLLLDKNSLLNTQKWMHFVVHKRLLPKCGNEPVLYFCICIVASSQTNGILMHIKLYFRRLCK